MQNSSMGTHLDPHFEDRILHEVKSHGVFDEFRKDSMADVDTKPAYQNLRQRVENSVKKFLSEQRWTPDMNKNQLREKLRKHIAESGFLDVGVERIVDQVVNPKIGTVFQPRIEEITYKYLGLPPPPVKHEPPPPIMHPLPPLPLSGPPPLKVDTSSLLPTGLEQVSPDSDKATVKSECREDDQSVMDMDIDVDIDEKLTEDDDESPPFEPLVKSLDFNKYIKTEVVEKREDIDVKPKIEPSSSKLDFISNVKQPKVESTFPQKVRDCEKLDIPGLVNATNIDYKKTGSFAYEADVAMAQDSQLSQVSSDSHISDVTANASHSFMDTSSTHNQPEALSDQTAAVLELASANISEEAQMPKFNENSCEIADAKSTTTVLHFDIKKDEIKFEGTERKINLLEQEGEGNSVNGADISPSQANTSVGNLENKEAPHPFGSLTIDTNVEPNNQTTGPTTPAATPTPTPHDSSFGSSLDASYQRYTEQCEDGLKNETSNVADVVLSAPLQPLSDLKNVTYSENRKSSSSRHKKHSKDKRRSHDSKDKYKHKDRIKNRDRSTEKDRSDDKTRSSEKVRHRNKESSRDKHKERRDKDMSKDNNKDKEGSRMNDKHNKSKTDSMDRSSSSKRSSSSTGRSHDTSYSKNEKSSTSRHTSSFMSSSSSSSRSEGHEAKREQRESHKKRHSSSSKNDSSSKKDDSKPETTKTEPTVDDHSSEKIKARRRKSTDSNDEDKSGGRGAGGHKSGSARENSSLHNSGTSTDKQKIQHKETKNASPCLQSPKSKSKSDLKEYDCAEKRIEDSSMINQVCDSENPNTLTTQPHRNKVIILSDMLENPNVNFIDLGPSMRTYSMATDDTAVDITLNKLNKASPNVHNSPPKNNITPPKIDNPKINNAPPEINITSPKADTVTTFTDTHLANSLEIKEEQLLYFDETNSQFLERLRLLDHAMDRCRRVVNNLRFDCANELSDIYETGDVQHNKSASGVNTTPQTCATLTIDCMSAYAMGDCFSNIEDSGARPVANVFDSVYELHGKRKRNNNGQPISSKPSPTPSDASVNSKENMALDKNAAVVKCVRRNASVNKLNQQQRYNSEDLYKPRPVLSQRSRRRGVDAII